MEAEYILSINDFKKFIMRYSSAQSIEGGSVKSVIGIKSA